MSLENYSKNRIEELIGQLCRDNSTIHNDLKTECSSDPFVSNSTRMILIGGCFKNYFRFHCLETKRVCLDGCRARIATCLRQIQVFLSGLSLLLWATSALILNNVLPYFALFCFTICYSDPSYNGPNTSVRTTWQTILRISKMILNKLPLF